MQNIFVYGTLLFPEIVEKLTGKVFKTLNTTLHHYQRYGIKDCDYPAIIEKENAVVEGKLILEVDNESMKILTFYEGDEYVKTETEVRTETSNWKATVFVWVGPQESLTENWDENEFRNNSLKDYLEIVVPNAIKEFNQFEKSI